MRPSNFVLAAVAVAFNEIVLLAESGETEKEVRLAVESGDGRRLQDAAGHLFGPQPRQRKDGAQLFLPPRRRRRRRRLSRRKRL